ncbi:MAG: MFS transporter [Novosphingobium sp.]
MAGLMQASPAPADEWRKYGTVLLPCLLGMMLSGLHGYSLGVMVMPLEQAFGWTRAQISIGPLIISCIGLVAGPIVGAGIDRIGPRPIAMAGVALTCAAIAFLSTATASIESWWLRWVLLGLAVTMISPTVWTTAINSLFDRNRGKALALILCGTGLVGAIAPPLTNGLVEAYGWRMAYVMLAAGAALAVLPLVLLFFRSAKDRASASGSQSARALSGLTASQGFRSTIFYKLAVAFFVFGTGAIALTTIVVPLLRSKGFGGGEAAAMAGLVGIGSLAGRFAGGFLLDWIDAKKVAAASVMAPMLSCALLIALPGSALQASAACLLLGLAVGTEVDACAYLAARHLGMRAFGSLFGTMNGVLLFGVGLAPVVANHVYDVTRSYDPVLWGLLPMCALSVALFLSLGRYPEFGESRSNPL